MSDSVEIHSRITITFRDNTLKIFWKETRYALCVFSSILGCAGTGKVMLKFDTNTDARLSR